MEKLLFCLFLLFCLTVTLLCGCTPTPSPADTISSKPESLETTDNPAAESAPESVPEEDSSSAEEETISPPKPEELPLLLTEEGMIWGSSYRTSYSIIDAPERYSPGTQADLEVWLSLLKTWELSSLEVYLPADAAGSDSQTALPLSVTTANALFYALRNAEFLPASPAAVLSSTAEEVFIGINPNGGYTFFLSLHEQYAAVYFYTFSEKAFYEHFFFFEMNHFDREAMREQIANDIHAAKTASPIITQPGTFYDGSAILPLVGSERTLLATQEKLDLLNEYIRSDRVARIDVYTGPSSQSVTLPLSADIADIIWHLFAKTELLLHDTLESVATGGGTTLVAYDAEGNLLFTASIGDYFFVTFAEDPSITCFFTTTNGQLTSTRIQSILYKLLENDHGQDFDQ